jgi:ABC-2 type transport system ATP-binding protein
VLKQAGLKVEQLSNGKLRVESATESIDWVLELMRDNHLPPAEVVTNPNALHELFVQALSASHANQS